MAQESDILIVGGGPVGNTAAIALARAGYSVTICAPKSGAKDPRTTAHLSQTVEFFKDLGIWERLEEKAFPLKVMRIVDGTNRIFRAPQTDFKSSEIGLEAFGYNLRNADVADVLETEMETYEQITHVDGTAVEFSRYDEKIRVTPDTADGEMVLETKFLVAADGKHSKVREHFLPDTRNWSYPQSALVVNFKHEFPSHETSTEFHTEGGPFTIVPQSNNTAGLVWLEKPEIISEVMTYPDEKLEQVIEEKMQSFLGAINLISKPASFPIMGLVANRFGDGNVALIGEAAHVFPPIGAQGFNLGARDVQDLVTVMKRFTSAENRGGQYNSMRKADIESRTLGVDLLNRSLLSGLLPNQMLRTFGLYALNKSAPLRKTAMKMGISPIRRMSG